VNLNNVAGKPFFILVVQLVGSTSVESTLLWRSNIPLKKRKNKKIKKIKKLKKRETFSQSVKKPTHSLPQKPRIHSK